MRKRQAKKNLKTSQRRAFPPLTTGGNRPVTWQYQLDHVKGQEHPTNTVTIFSRVMMEYDESGENGFERFSTVTLTRSEIAEILRVLDQDIADMRRYCPNDTFI